MSSKCLIVYKKIQTSTLLIWLRMRILVLSTKRTVNLVASVSEMKAFLHAIMDLAFQRHRTTLRTSANHRYPSTWWTVKSPCRGQRRDRRDQVMQRGSSEEEESGIARVAMEERRG